MRAAILTALLLTATAAAADNTSFVSAAPSQLVLEGSSNVAAWRCRGTTLDGRAELVADQIEGFTLTVPVSTLRCGNRQMERDMYEALRSQNHPAIEFHFTRLIGDVRRGHERSSYTANILGVLSLAGATRTICLTVEAQRISSDRLRLRARLPLRMTDFAIQPPTALFGLVKASNELMVEFDLLLETAP